MRIFFQLIQNGHQLPFCEKNVRWYLFCTQLFWESCILTRYGKKDDKNLFQVSTIAGGGHLVKTIFTK